MGFEYDKFYKLTDGGELSYFNSLYFIVYPDGIVFKHYNFKNDDKKKRINMTIDEVISSGNFMNNLFHYLNIYDEDIPAIDRNYSFKNDFYTFVHNSQRSMQFLPKNDLYNFISNNILNYRFHYIYLLNKAKKENNLEDVYYLEKSIKDVDRRVKHCTLSKDYGFYIKQDIKLLKSGDSYNKQLKIKEELQEEKEEKARIEEEHKIKMASFSEEERKRATIIAMNISKKNKDEAEKYKLSDLASFIYRNNYVRNCEIINEYVNVYYTFRHYSLVNTEREPNKKKETLRAIRECHLVYFKKNNINIKNLRFVGYQKTNKYSNCLEFLYKYVE